MVILSIFFYRKVIISKHADKIGITQANVARSSCNHPSHAWGHFIHFIQI